MNRDSGAMADAAIVGGGPAGLAASLTLAQAGLAVTLIDEQRDMGGQYYRQRSGPVRTRLGDHRPAGRRLIEKVRQAGVTCLTSTTVWAAERGCLRLHHAESPISEVRAKAIVIATGAAERQVPFDGWQLPGIVTAGLAQHLASAEGIPVGHRVVVAGSGPFLVPVAAEICRRGARVAAVIEAGRPYVPSTHALPGALFPSRLAQLAGAFAILAAHRTPIVQGSVVVRAEPDDRGRLTRVAVARTHSPGTIVRWYEADALCTGYGFRPQNELLRLMGCDMQEDAVSHELFPITDGEGRTSVCGVYVAGETTGIGGVHSALAEGQLAAASILTDRGAPPPDRVLARVRRAKAHEDRFARLSDVIYPRPMELARTLLTAAPGTTQVCRCEGVCLSALTTQAGDEPHDLSGVKTRTRAGMGPCQGRECSYALAAALDGRLDSLNARIPVRPLPLSSVLEDES